MLARIINITYAVIYSVETMESAIFLDQTKLSARYIPNELPHREKQIEEICHVFIGPSSPDDCPLTVLQIFRISWHRKDIHSPKVFKGA